MATLTRLSVVAALALTSIACERTSKPRDECEVNEDCNGQYCLQGVCVECSEDKQCDKHRICATNTCELLGAERENQAQNAHGNWRGTPGQPGYDPIDTCTINEDCSFGELCNPFTAGCIRAVDFTETCDDGTCSETGPNGETLACEPQSDTCYPAPRCTTDRNCAGYDEFVCDPGSGVCQFQQRECTPPTASETQPCPFSPRLTDECTVPGLFCSPLGRCVQCTCNLDCDANGGLPVCYAPTGRCVREDFCTRAGECTPDKCDGPTCSCDRRNQMCQPYCDQADDCGDNQYCDTLDNVCRPEVERPCLTDSLEGSPNNDQSSSAADLPLPAMGESVEIPADSDHVLSLCDTDTYTDHDDWYALDLSAGDAIRIIGSSNDGLIAVMTAFAADGFTVLDTGAINPIVGDLLHITAGFDAVYWVHIASGYDVVAGVQSTGTYRLSVTLTRGQSCSDAFEVNLGRNDTPAVATVLNDETAGIPADCTGTLGAQQMIECKDGVNMCLGDVDYYLINASAGATVSATIDSFSNNLDLHLYGPFAHGEVPSLSPQADYSTGPGVSSEAVMAATRAAGSFLLRVSRTSGEASVYSLAVEVLAGPVCSEDRFDDESGESGSTGDPASMSPFIEDPASLNDTLTTATFIDVDPSSAATLTVATDETTPLTLCGGDVDWFRLGAQGTDRLVNVDAGLRITGHLTVSSLEEGDKVFVSVGSSSEAMQLDEDDSTAFTISVTNGGPLYLRVYGAPTNIGAVAYTIEIGTIAPECAPDNRGDTTTLSNDDPNDAYALIASDGWPTILGDPAHEETALSLCTRLDGTSLVRDIDWYTIGVPAGSEVAATVHYDASESEANLTLFASSVLNATNLDSPNEIPNTGLLVESVVNGLGTERARVNATGTIYIRVGNESGWPISHYSLEVRLLPLACTEDEHEPNQSWDPGVAMPLSMASVEPPIETGTLDELSICTGADRDWYTVPLGIGDEITATLFSHPTEGEIDFYLYRPGPAGVQDLNTFITHKAVTSEVTTLNHKVAASGPVGDYLLQVRPEGSGPFANRYALETRVARECIDDSFEDFSLLVLGNHYPELQLCGDEDWFTFVPNGAGDVTVCALFSHAAGNIDLFVYDELDPPSIIRGAQSLTDDERASFQAVADVSYYVRVFTPTPVNTAYELHVLWGDVPCP